MTDISAYASLTRSTTQALILKEIDLLHKGAAHPNDWVTFDLTAMGDKLSRGKSSVSRAISVLRELGLIQTKTRRFDRSPRLYMRPLVSIKKGGAK